MSGCSNARRPLLCGLLLVALTLPASDEGARAQQGPDDGEADGARSSGGARAEGSDGDDETSSERSEADEQRLHSRVMPNGLTVVVYEDDRIPLATIELTVRAGAIVESPGYNGLNHLYEHMFFKGNEVLPDELAYRRRLRQLGALHQGTTSAEQVNFYFTLPSDNLADGLEFMRDAIVSPKFDPEEFEREKKVVLHEFSFRDSLEAELGRKMTRKMWWKHPSRRSAIGARHVIERASLRKMRRLRERYYVPDNAALLVGGDVDAEAVFARVGELFATWKKGEAGHERSTPLTHPPLKRSRVAVVEADIRVPILRYLWRGPGARRDRRDTYIADVLCELTSRHDELPYTLSYQTLGYTGVFRVRQSRAASIVLGMVRYNREKFDAIGEEEFFTAEQLAEAKRAIRRKRIFSRQSPSSFLHTIAYFWTIADLDYHQNYLDEIDSVTLEEVRRVARTYIAKKPYVLGLMISEKYKKQYEISAAKLRRLVAPRDDD